MHALTETEIRQAYNEVFSTEAGRVVWLDLLHHFGFMGKTTRGVTPEETYANEGSRCVTLHIHGRVNGVAPDQQTEAER